MHLLDATMFWNPSGGVRRYVGAKRRWARGVAHWTHTVATPMPDAPGDLRVPSLPMPGSDGQYRYAWPRFLLAGLLCEARPDLIEAADPYQLGWASVDAADRLGVPAVAFCHSDPDTVARQLAGARFAEPARRFARRRLRALYAHFDLVLAPSETMAAKLRDMQVERVLRQPLGVDTGVFHPRRRHERWRSSLPLPADARLLVYAGRFAPEKNLTQLVQAVRRLGSRYWLIAIGDGPCPPCGDRVICAPPLRHDGALATALATADLFVHAGADETFGLSVLEAMACGTPVVARAAGGLAELIDERVGSAVPDASPSVFADAFAEAIDAQFERDLDMLSANARERAAGYAWDEVLPLLWSRYGSVLAGQRPPHPAAAQARFT